MDTFPDVMQELIKHYNLETFESQLKFVESHFSKEVIEQLFYYYPYKSDAIQYINSPENFKIIDNYTSLGLSKFYSDIDNMNRNLFIDYDMSFLSKNTFVFVQELKYFDKFYPEHNVIPTFLIYAIENYKESSPETQLNIFINYFDMDRLCKDDILKNYFIKHEMISCLNKIEGTTAAPSF